MRFTIISALIAVAVARPQDVAQAPPTTTAAAPSAPAAPTLPGAVPTHSTAPISGGQNPFTAPLGDVKLEAGKPIEITWSPNYGEKVTIALRKGSDPNNLDYLVDIAADIDNTGSYKWTPPKELEASDDYALEVIAGNTSNFTPPLEIDSEGEGLASTKSVAKPVATETSESASASETEEATKTTTSAKATSTDDEEEDDEDSSSSATGSASSTRASSTSTSTRTSSASDSEETEQGNDAAVDNSIDDAGSGAAAVKSSFALIVGAAIALAIFN